MSFVFVVRSALCMTLGLSPAQLEGHGIEPEEVLRAYDPRAQIASIAIRNPLDETVFPADLAPPTFRWHDVTSDVWVVTVAPRDRKGDQNEDQNRGQNRIVAVVTAKPSWTPSDSEWKKVQTASLDRQVRMTVLGARRGAPGRVLARGEVRFTTSSDPVAAPIFYREVNLPFIDAVKDPSKIRWRLGSVSSSRKPPVILQGLPVCGNCHSFTADGKALAMDVDYANDKGSYVITRVREEMVLATSDIITWDDYQKGDGVPTFGLLSQISPDGAHVISTVKDRSVFVPTPELAFSQLFFPIQGILVVYDRRTGDFRALPGGDDPEFVQSNPTWSPDGRTVVFARSKAYRLRRERGRTNVLLSKEECSEFLKEGKPFRFDLYRVAFNGGRGGEAEPLRGASHNGMSNYFPKFSPDGKWIVFCKAKNYMLLRPDSKLYIIPAAGGEARELRCNTKRMNSWHSWSPNGKWLVFSSKANSPYTQLFLTHMDGEGRSSPPVVLEHFTAPDRAANIPEFVNAPPAAIRRIREEFLNDYSFVRAGHEFFKAGEADNAIAQYRQALRLNPENVEAHLKLGFLLYHVKEKRKEGMEHSLRALQLSPTDGAAHYEVGMVYLHRRAFDKAAMHLAESVRLMPRGRGSQYEPASMRLELARALLFQGKLALAMRRLKAAADLDPKSAPIQYELSKVFATGGKVEEALGHLRKALALQPAIDTSPELHGALASHLARRGKLRAAVVSARRARKLALAAGRPDLARELERRIKRYEEAVRRGR